ncbi:MAG: type II secretion system protein [Verrucomicrobiales bacterium]|nr:type II secretion system protein [Verrucomicrobiales bacterium]
MRIPRRASAVRRFALPGFSLTELLVVIAVLAVLSALVLSALPGVRERGKRSACRGNLRQWSLGLHLYGADNQDLLPEGRIPLRTAVYLPLVPTHGARALASYAGSSNILDCPNVRPMLLSSNEWRWPYERDSLQLGYLYLGGRGPNRWEATGGPVTSAWVSPARLSGDPQATLVADLTYAAPCVSRIVAAHGRTGFVVRTSRLSQRDAPGYVAEVLAVAGGANVARLDGSVEWRERRQLRWYRGAYEGPMDNTVCMAAW